MYTVNIGIYMAQKRNILNDHWIMVMTGSIFYIQFSNSALSIL